MKNVELYFLPTSFYSQRVRLALEEKGIEYKKTFVFLTENEQDQAWYLKINPKGEVPTIRIGSEYFGESEKIVDIVDKLPSEIQNKLVPDIDTAEGKLVAFWRQKIDEIKIPIITFGVSVYPEFAKDKPILSIAPNAQGVKDRFEKNIRDSKTLMTKHPELKESYERKISLAKQRLVDFFDKEKLAAVLNSMDDTMAEIEQQLSKIAKESDSTGTDYYLCGETFTSADINLCILFGRFKLIGLLHRYSNPKKYPNLGKYWQRLQKRKTVEKVVINNVVELKRLLFRRQFCRYVRATAALVFVGIAGWLAYRHFNT